MKIFCRIYLWLLGYFCLPNISTCFIESDAQRYSRGPGDVAGEVEGRENDEKRLLRFLVNGYERDVRPVRNATTPVVIKLGITLTQIFDMDEKNQVLTTVIWLDQEWKDELLTWDPNNFSGLTVLRMPCERIWLPDIVLYNNADDYTRGYMNSRAMVNFEGQVFWPPPTKFRSTCPVDVTYFPFDDQTCILKLGSWTYNGFQVDVTNRTPQVDLTNYVQNGEWELLEAYMIRNVVYYPCCPEPFPDLTVTLKMRRKILYYMYNIVLPCMMMSVLTLLVFCLPPESGEKIALGITVLLAFSVFMLAIAEKMPETSESVPLIGIYLTAVMAITSISVVMTVIVLNCHYKGPTSKQVPRWIRRYFLRSESNTLNYPATPYQSFEDQSGRAEGVSSNNRNDNGGLKSSPSLVDSLHPDDIPSSEFISGLDTYRSLTNTVTSVPTHPTFRLRVSEYSTKRKHSFVRFSKKFKQAKIENGEDCNELEGMKIALPSSQTFLTSTETSPLDVHPLMTSSFTKDSTNLVTSSSQQPQNLQNQHQNQQQSNNFNVSTDQDSIVRYFLDRQRYAEDGQSVVVEWRQVAAVVDRILFWIFCVLTCISSALFLLIIPGYNRGWFSFS